MTRYAEKLVILAAGLGTRMREHQSLDGLSDEQQAVARTGVKAMIPVGRPFLDYLLSRAADAGLTQICLVIGPQHDHLRQYYEGLAPRRLSVTFAVQPQPLGTANAVAAAEKFVAQDPFLVLNSDNCYPTRDLRQLCCSDGPAVVGFDRDALASNSNMSAERLARFALVERDPQGRLRRIVEKPNAELIRKLDPPVLVGMNCWRFSTAIFLACRRISQSMRGEYELPDAVSHSVRQLGESYQVFTSGGPVLDLSSQHDIAAVKEQLQGEHVRL
jgi:glucose-1-phosphate thymidylyltransferase